MTIAVSPDELAIVRDSLARFLPSGARVWIYGSRARGTRIWRGSDLDLLIRADEPLKFALVDDLAEELSESLLPYLVDLHDWHRTDADFLARIASDMVPLEWQGAAAQ